VTELISEVQGLILEHVRLFVWVNSVAVGEIRLVRGRGKA